MSDILEVTPKHSVRCHRCGAEDARAADYLQARDGQVIGDYRIEACLACRYARRITTPLARTR